VIKGGNAMKQNRKKYTFLSLYSQEIGTITPFVQEELEGLRALYGEEAMVEAISRAVRDNHRTMTYVRRILERRAASV